METGFDEYEAPLDAHTLIPTQVSFQAAEQSLFDQAEHGHYQSTTRPSVAYSAPSNTYSSLTKRSVNEVPTPQQSYNGAPAVAAQAPKYNRVMTDISIKVTENNVLSGYQFFVHPSSRFINSVSLVTTYVLLFSVALGIWAAAIVFFDASTRLSPFRYVAIIGTLVTLGLDVFLALMYMVNNVTFSLQHCVTISSPIIWANVVLITASFILQNFVADYGSTVHTSHVNQYARLIGIMSLFIINAVVTVLTTSQAYFSHAYPEEKAPRNLIALGTSDEQLESSQLIALARQLYQSVRGNARSQPSGARDPRSNVSNVF